jgi:AcrR family transcriptional regulator
LTCHALKNIGTPPPVPAAKTAPSNARSAKLGDILAAATKLFMERGFGDTSMDEVALQANVSKRTIYDKFANKQALFAEVIQSLCEKITMPEILILAEDDDIESVLNRFGVWFLTQIYSRDQVSLFQTVINDSRRFPEIGEMMFYGPIRRTQEAVANYLAAQGRKGRLNVPDPAMAAAFLVGMLKTDVHMMLLLGQPRKNVTKDIQKAVAAAVKLFLSGTRPA